MGITAGTISLIADAVRRRPAGGTALTFGVQGVQLRAEGAVPLLKSLGALRSTDTADLRVDEATQFGATIHQDSLFRLLGFDVVESVDYYANENPTHLADLNRPLPADLTERYDLVYDGGTLEHCFNAPQVMANAVAALRVGGTVIHHVPLNNWVNHGFYQFSPCLFFDFYETNGFTDLTLKIHRLHKGKESFADYDPVNPPEGLSGGRERALCFFYATKARAGSEITFPIQGHYREVFGNEGGPAAPRKKASLGRKLRRLLGGRG